jgi:tetratricopeptide (TPR) repeat protein
MKFLIFISFFGLICLQWTVAQGKALKLVGKGNDFFERMDFIKADEFYNRALAIDSNCVEAYIQKSDIFIQKSEFKSSFDWIQIALTIANKTNTEKETIAHIYSIRSFVYFNLNDYTNSINDLNTAISLNDENSNYFYMRALIRRMNSDMKGCCADLKKASSLGMTKANESLTLYCK